MDDAQLDDLLRRSALSPSLKAQGTAVLMAKELHGADHGVTSLRGSRVRRRVVVAAAAATAAMALVGGGTFTAYRMSIPPFQGLDEGTGRAVTGIPVIYTNSLGRRVECSAFIEYANLNAQQVAAIEKVSKSRQWDGYGQRVLDRLAMPDATPDAQNAAITEVVHQDLWKAAHEAVPSMVYMHDSDGPIYHGSSTYCSGPGGVDGQR